MLASPLATRGDAPMWAMLFQLSCNLWCDRQLAEHCLPHNDHLAAQPFLRFDQSLWNDLLPVMAQAGVNAVVLDLGDAVQYESHPEIAVEGAWTPDKLRDELAKMRALGIEPIPKLNFSATHDIWLGEYGRMVSTAKYYEVCRDLIGEVIELFDTPRLFHLGMDEELAEYQSAYLHTTVRRHELWWHDLFFLLGEVERGAVRPWVWSDALWSHPEEFLQQMPRSVMQSNWYYSWEFNPDDAQLTHEAPRVRAYLQLEEAGFDQIPTGSGYYALIPDLKRPIPPHQMNGKAWKSDTNFERTVEWCRERIAPQRLQGFLSAPWVPTVEKHRATHLKAIEEVARAIRRTTSEEI